MAEKINGLAAKRLPPAVGAALLAVCAILYFCAVCLMSADTIKTTALVLAVIFLISALVLFIKPRGRVGVPLILLAAVLIMDAASTLYAASGKYALYEFLKPLSAFCLALVLLACAPGGRQSAGRWIAKVLSGFSAIAGLVSIDLLSTRLFSGVILDALARFAPAYGELAGVETGIRMTSMFGTPNVFAGVAGLGVLLSLGLAASSEHWAERVVQTAILYVNSLAFVLAFSIGASGSIAAAFLILLLLERRGERAGLLILMGETLVCTVLSAGVISVTSFQMWNGVQPVPLLCTALGAAALCAADKLVGQRLTRLLEKRSKLVPYLVSGLLAVLAIFGLTAYHLTGPVTLEAGEGLRRAAYPGAGTYTLSAESDGTLNVVIESQDQRDTMMHTSAVLYSGSADAASFEVPEGSLVVYFNFSAPEGAGLRSASYSGENGAGDIPLEYMLLPGFIANRLQGLWANENAIQRAVFFSDGLKLFRRSPVYGLGLGAFENGVKSVQPFPYVTKYVHNHYIQTLAETGLIGLTLFLLLLGGSAAAVLFERRKVETSHPLTPALGAALVFMAIHAATEVVFSSYPYLPVAFGVFVLISLCCGDALPGPGLDAPLQRIFLLAISAVVVSCSVLLFCNIRAKDIVQDDASFEVLDEAISLDKFEWADYALTYINLVSYMDVSEEIHLQADKYAQRLERLNSNTVPIYLARYYFKSGRTEKAMAMVEKHVTYVSSDAEAWQQAFNLMIRYEEDRDVFRAGVLRIAQLLDAWNAANMEEITVSESAQALIARAGG